MRGITEREKERRDRALIAEVLAGILMPWESLFYTHLCVYIDVYKMIQQIALP